jgi:hypothetical protein
MMPWDLDLNITTKCRHWITGSVRLSLSTPVQRDYALMRDATVMLHKEIWDRNDLEYTDNDYEEVTKESMKTFSMRREAKTCVAGQSPTS